MNISLPRGTPGEVAARLLRSRRARVLAYVLVGGLASVIAEMVISPSSTEAAARVAVACVGLIVLDYLVGLIAAGWSAARRPHSRPVREGTRRG